MKYQKGSFIVVPNRGKLRGIGGNAQCLFMWLCSYTNTDGNCFPSLNRLAEDVGCNSRTIIREMKKLIELGIIIKEYRKSDNSQLSNLYSVLILEEEGGSVTQTPPSVIQSPPPVSKSHTNSIHSNSIYITQLTSKAERSSAPNETNQIIALFKGVNPSYERLFGNRTQRLSVERLIKKHGFDKVAGWVEALPEILKDKFAPRITTPFQLEEKLGQLFFHVEGKKRKTEGKIIRSGGKIINFN